MRASIDPPAAQRPTTPRARYVGLVQPLAFPGPLEMCVIASPECGGWGCRLGAYLPAGKSDVNKHNQYSWDTKSNAQSPLESALKFLLVGVHFVLALLRHYFEKQLTAEPFKHLRAFLCLELPRCFMLLSLHLSLSLSSLSLRVSQAFTGAAKRQNPGWSELAIQSQSTSKVDHCLY